LYVSNLYIRVTNERGLDFKLCHECLFGLNGQVSDDNRLFVGLNRAVGGVTAAGYGICAAEIAWACPWCE